MMKRSVGMAVITVVLLCVTSVQAVDVVVIYSPYHWSDGTHDMGAYYSGASQGLETSSPDWNGGSYGAPWAGDDFSTPTGYARMLVIRFRELFGTYVAGPGQLPKVPIDATIVKAELNLNVWTGYGTPATVIKCFTGLTPWYSSFFGVDTDFSTSTYRKWNAMEAWDGSIGAGNLPSIGIDYSSDSVDVEVDFVESGGVYSIEEYITFNVTSDVRAYQDGSLDNNGWWIGTNQLLAAGRYQIGGFSAGWALTPELVITWRIGPLVCDDLSPEEKGAADINGDCTVNLADVAIVAANWMDCVDPAGCL